MATDKNNQYLVTGDVDGLIKVWEILEYAMHSVDQPIKDLPRKFKVALWAIFISKVGLYLLYISKDCHK